MEKKKILVVDDEANIRLLVASMLKDSFTVITATDGQEAIDAANAQKPALILMDIMMPRVDGYTACSVLKARAETRAIPVVMLTGVGYELNRTLAKKVGADGYITKPFNIQDIRKVVDELMPD